MTDTLKRCKWVNLDNELYVEYHDKEWGVPVHCDRKLFEMLVLEGAQAGLSWETVLNKREYYKNVFYDFDVVKVSKMSDEELEILLKNSKIIKNRLKVFSARKNAKVFLDIQKDLGSFNKYIWGYVDNKPIVNNWASSSEVPVSTQLSITISKDLKKRGMSFVGPTIIYSYMQAVGIVNDHVNGCYLKGSQFKS